MTMTRREAGRLGGLKVRDEYGVEFYEEIGHRGGNVTLYRHGREHFQRIGRLGRQKQLDAQRAQAAGFPNDPPMPVESSAVMVSAKPPPPWWKFWMR